MKKRNWKIWMGMVAALIAMMNLVPVVSAAETAGITVTVTVSYLSFNLSSNTVNFGTIRNATMVNSSVTVANNGNWLVNFTLSQSCTLACNWTIGTGIQGTDIDKYVMAGRFNVTGDPGLPGDGDVITTTPQMANAARFGSNGTNIANETSRNLWLFFNAPKQTTNKSQQNIAITIGVVAT